MGAAGIAMNHAPSFGRWLRERRKALDLTQMDLAAQVGCAEATIGRIETDERRPSRQLAELLAAVLAVPDAERAAFVHFARSGDAAGFLVTPAPEAAQAPPPPFAGPLTAPLTPLIGRNEAIAALRRTFDDPAVRLLTLTGPPGIGKTRLALELAGALAAEFDGGVTFVALATIRDPALVPSAVAQALGLQDTGDALPTVQVADYLWHRHLLLVLDNFEQVVEAAPLVIDWLAACPDVKVLVTSREALNVRGEHQFVVPPLTLPDLDHLPVGELLDYAAVALFVERAQAGTPAFALTGANAGAIATICRRLDGLPLAIELAAARVRLLSPQAMATRLESRLALLTGGPRDLPARQQTLRAAIGWSYDLLPPGEQRLFARLGVFQGGFTLAAVEAVCNAGGDLPVDPLDAIQSLMDKSLVRQAAEGADVRFSMLETIREYAWERLEAHGEAATIAQRHCEHFLALAEAAALQFAGGVRAAWARRLERDYDNLRAALHWSLAAPRPDDLAARLAGALWQFWMTYGYVSEGRDWLERALAAPPAAPGPTAGGARALFGAGKLAACQGDLTAAHRLLTASLAAWEALGDGPQAIGTRCELAGLAREEGDLARARALAEESAAQARALADRENLAWALYHLGMVDLRERDQARSRARFEEALALLREIGNALDVMVLLQALADATSMQGDYAAACRLAEESLTLARTVGDRRDVVASLHNLGYAAYRYGDFPRAATLLAETTAQAAELGLKGRYAWSLNHRGDVARRQGDYERAAALYAESLARFGESGEKQGTAAVRHNLGYVARHSGDMRLAATHFAAALTLFTELGYAWSIADTLAGVAGVLVGAGDSATAAQLFSAARAQHAAMDPSGALGEPANQAEWEQTAAALRAALDEPALSLAAATGQTWPLDQAIAHARAALTALGAPA
jgi:predicted ATPase/DNA-binding XRE family transcriptional regulator